MFAALVDLSSVPVTHTGQLTMTVIPTPEDLVAFPGFSGHPHTFVLTFM